MKKKTLLPFMTVLLVFIFLAAHPVSATQTSGSCGSNLTWQFDEATGTLTISGQGEMTGGNNLSWHVHSKNITKVVIGEGVTSVGEAAFHGHCALTSVTLPSSMRTIGINAFNGCGALTQIDLKNVTTLQDYAFSSCNSLTAIVIPSGVKTIGYGAFSACFNLTSVTLPNGLTKIDNYAFSGCAKLSAITLPDSIIAIDDSAFSGTALTEITLPASLTTLGSNAFSQCTKLERIRIPDRVTQIQTNTFNGCAALTEVNIGKSVQKVSDNAFVECIALKAFSVSSENRYLSTDDQGILYNKNKTELLLFPYGFSGKYSVQPGTTKIAPWAAYNVKWMTEIILPAGVTTIGRNAFSGCDILHKVTLPEGLKTIEEQAFRFSGIQEIIFPSTLTKITSGAFDDCKELKKITFLGSPPLIGNNSFSFVSATVTYSCSKGDWAPILKAQLYGEYGYLCNLVFTSTDYVAVTVPGQEATCTSSGYSDSTVCGTCGKVAVPPTFYPKESHDYAIQEVLDERTHRLTCADCGHTVTGSHSITAKVIQKSTCTTPGSKLHSCLECDYELTESLPVDEKGHVYDHGCDPDCNECGTKRETKHVFGKEWNADAAGHWRICLVCQSREETATHTPGPEATSAAGQTCTVCKYEMAPPLSNSTEPTTPSETPIPSASFPWWSIPAGLSVVCIAGLVLRRKKR